MSTTHYVLYQKCFPDYPLDYENFYSMTGIGDTAVLLEEREGDRLVGFAISSTQWMAEKTLAE